MIDTLNAIVALANYVFIPAIAYGSQLALGALGVTLIYGILRFSNFSDDFNFVQKVRDDQARVPRRPGHDVDQTRRRRRGAPLPSHIRV